MRRAQYSRKMKGREKETSPTKKFERPNATAVFSGPIVSAMTTGGRIIWHPLTKPHKRVRQMRIVSLQDDLILVDKKEAAASVVVVVVVIVVVIVEVGDKIKGNRKKETPMIAMEKTYMLLLEICVPKKKGNHPASSLPAKSVTEKRDRSITAYSLLKARPTT